MMNSAPSSKRQVDFKSLVEQHQERVRNTCFGFVRNPQDADDVAQEVFIQVYESLSHFREEAEFSTWIYRIAVNKSLDFIRRKKRKKRFALVTSILGFGGGDEQVELPSSEDPLKELVEKERKEVLNRAIERLPENQKTAVTLSKIEGFSNKEIASVLNMSVSAVEALIHRAKQNLRKNLFSYYTKQ